MVNATQTVDSIVSARRIIEGPRDLLRSVSARKYDWTKEVSKNQEKNRWFPSQINVSRDSLGFDALSRGSKTGYKRGTAFVSNLDAIQCDNLAENLYPHITDPHIQQCLATQVAEEWIHVETYSNIIETVVKGDALEIYQMYRDVPELAAKNDHVIAQGRNITSSAAPFGENFVRALAANMALEGIYFFSGFATFYAIGRAAGGSLTGTVDSIKYIQRDEQEHLWMFQNIWHSLRAERPELFTAAVLDDCRAIFVDAVEREKSWGYYVIDEGIPMLGRQDITDYIQFRGEEVAKDVGLGGIYRNQKHNLLWIDDYQMNKGHKNFFEGRPGAYQHDSLVFGTARKPRTSVSIGSMLGQTNTRTVSMAA